MKNEVDAQIHQVELELAESTPTAVPVTTDIRLTVKAVCHSGCDLRRVVLRVVAADQEVVATEVANADETSPADSRELHVCAPGVLGAHTWTITFPRQELDGIVHAETSIPFSFETRPLGTSLAVWGISGPTVIGQSFTLNVGAKSTGDWVLKGAEVEILNEAGERVGSGRLGDRPWEGTTALYWAEVEATAPQTEGPANWSARFAPHQLDLPHEGSTAEFSFVATRPRDHALTITVVDKETKAPVPNAHVRLGVFRASTDECGLAVVAVPEGTYELKAWMTAHEIEPMTLEVRKSTSLLLEAVALPEEDTAARWM